MSESNQEMSSTFKKNKRFYKIIVVITAFFSAWSFIISRSILPIIILIPLWIYLSKNKPQNPKEQEEMDVLGAESFAFSMLIPALICFAFFIYIIFWKVFPAIYKNLDI